MAVRAPADTSPEVTAVLGGALPRTLRAVLSARLRELGRDERIIDYRPGQLLGEVPSECPVCGAALDFEDYEGRINIGELEFDRVSPRWGIADYGPATTRTLLWSCAATPDHYWGPTIVG